MSISGLKSTDIAGAPLYPAWGTSRSPLSRNEMTAASRPCCPTLGSWHGYLPLNLANAKF